MMRSVLDYKASQLACENADYENLHDLNRLLSQFRDTMRISLVDHCSQKKEQSESDMQLSSGLHLSEYEILSGSTRKTLDRIKPIDYYKNDLKKLKTILARPDSMLFSDTYPKTLSGYFATAWNKLNRKSSAEAELMVLFQLFAGDSRSVTDKYEAIHGAYDEALTFLITEPERFVRNYCGIVLRTIKEFSAKLAPEEFYPIYMDMLNHTAADFLGSELVEIVNSYSFYSFVTDRECAYDDYLATGIQ